MQHSRRVYVAGADAWMGAETHSVCRQIYPMPDKKTAIGAKWSSRFLRWSRAWRDHIIFVWPTPQDQYYTITLEDFVGQYK